MNFFRAKGKGGTVCTMSSLTDLNNNQRSVLLSSISSWSLRHYYSFLYEIHIVIEHCENLFLNFRLHNRRPEHKLVAETFAGCHFPSRGVIGFPSSMSGSTHSLAERWERCWANTQTQGRGQRMLTGRAEINTNPDISTHSIPNQNIERVFRYILWTEAHPPIYKIHIQIFYHKFWQNPNSTKQCKLPPEPHNTKTFNKIGGIHTFDSEFLTKLCF